MGKINVINTLVASLFVYKMSTLPRISNTMEKQMNQMFNKFLWNGHKPKIPLSTLQLLKRDGSMQLVDLSRKDDALKITWVRMIFADQYPEEIPHSQLHPGVGKNIWVCNLKHTDVDDTCTGASDFWKDVLKAWCKYHYTVDWIGDQIVWCNSNIRIGNSPVWWEQPARKGLVFVSDLIEENEVIKAESAKSRYGLSTMQFNSLMSAVGPRRLQWCIMNPDSVFVDTKFSTIMNQEHVSQYAYRCLSPAPDQLQKIEEKWCVDFLEEVDLKKLLVDINRTQETAKLKSFQYRLLMRSVITNIQLCNWRIIDTKLCTFCESYNETIRHLLYECECVKEVIKCAQDVCERITGEQPMLNYKNYICNSVSKGIKASNTILLVTKQYIYRQRCKKIKPSSRELVSEIYRCKNIEKFNAIKNNRYPKYAKKWCESISSENVDRMQNLTAEEIV